MICICHCFIAKIVVLLSIEVFKGCKPTWVVSNFHVAPNSVKIHKHSKKKNVSSALPIQRYNEDFNQQQKIKSLTNHLYRCI